MDLDRQKLEQSTDVELVALTLQGKTEAFDQLVRRYHSPLLAFLKFYCFGKADIDDVGQIAFLKAFQNLEQFDPSLSFKTWLYTIARRSISNVVSRTVYSLDACSDVAQRDMDPAERTENVENQQLLWSRIREVVSDDDFQMIWLRYAEQISIKEMAAIMKQSEAACKMRLSRLRKRLEPHLLSFVEHASLRKFCKVKGAA